MPRLQIAKSNRLSPAQNAYAAAKALYEVQHKAAREYDKLIDAEGVRLGIAQPGEMYVILPEGHPMLAKAQQLLNAENEARKLMYEAAHNLFDWATETVLTIKGTPQQKAEIRQMVATVKTKAHVEEPFEHLVEISMRFAA